MREKGVREKGVKRKRGQIFEFDIFSIWIRIRSYCFFNIRFDSSFVFRHTRFWLTVL